MIFIYKLT